LTRGSKDLIQEKMIVTVEPGLYIDGVGGMIIEDPNIVLKDHAERLTSSPHEWS
jgi:Xaa-Pro aminopeptidase